MTEINKQDLEQKLKKIKMEEKMISEELTKRKKYSKSTGKIFSYIEVIAVFIAVYVATPLLLLFMPDFGIVVAKFYESNLNAIVGLFGAFSAIFVAKTFSKTLEHKGNQVYYRKSFGKTLVGTVGFALFVFYIIVYPYLSKFNAYIGEFSKKISWQTIGFLITIGGLYIGNKLIFAFNKEEVLKAIVEEEKKEG
jgi:hypothetical protein